MKRTVPHHLSLAVLFLSVAIPLHSKDRAWQTGRLVSFGDESWASGSTTPVHCSSSGTYTNCIGGDTTNWNHVTYHVTVMDGRTSYYALRTLSFRWQHLPKVTENARVKFAVEGGNLFLIDDDGREFKMSIEKKRNNGPAERLQECRTTMQELHEAHTDLPKVNQWLAELSGPDLLNTYTYNMECSTLSMELSDLPLFSQFEAVRAEMLVARARQGVTVAPQPETAECSTVAVHVEGSSIKNWTTEQIAVASQRLYDCAMATFACGKCGDTRRSYTEKGIDVALATKLLVLANNRAFETAILVSGDKDYLETVKAVKSMGIRVEVVSWRRSLSQELSQESSKTVILLDDIRAEIERPAPDAEVDQLMTPDEET